MLSPEDKRLQRAGRLPQETRDYLDSKKRRSTVWQQILGVVAGGLFGLGILHVFEAVFKF